MCVCLGSGFGCAPPLLAGVLGCVCAGVRAPLVPRHYWLECAVWVCVFLARVSAAPRHFWLGCWGLRVCVRAPLVPRHSWLGPAALVCVLQFGFRLRLATAGWGFGVCVCWCGRSPCTPPLLAGVCGVGVCVRARVSAAPRHSWLGCWGVRVGVRAPPVPRHSWLGCAAWVCVLRLGFFAAPRHSWLGCWGLCVLVFPLRLYPATPGRGVRRVCVCVWVRVSAAPRHSSPGFPGVCVLVCLLLLYPATPGWGVRRWCVCSGSGFGCAPPLLAGLLGFVCTGVRAPLVLCHPWLGCVVWVCVFGLGFRLRPATPGWGVGVCVCLSAYSTCTPQFPARVCGVGVCAWSRVSAAPRHSWLGCWVVCVLVFPLRFYLATPGWGVRRGSVCSGAGFGCALPLLAGAFGCVWAGVRAPPVPRHSWLGCALWVCVLGLRFLLRPATPGWGVCCVGWLLPGTCSCAVVRCVLCALPGFAGPGGRCGLAPVLVPWLWLAACLSGVPRGPALVRRASSGPVALGALVAFPSPCCLSPPRGLAPLALLGGCARHAEAGREPGSLCLPLAPAEAGALGSLRDGVVPRDADSQRIQFAFAELAANSFAAPIRCEFGLKSLVLRIRGEFALRICRRRQNDHACAVFSPDEKLTLNCAMQYFF